MAFKKTVLFLIYFSIGSCCYGQNNVVERSDWVQYFNQFDAKGTIVVVDQRGQYPKNWVYDNDRALKRYSPASTYKIPHTLFALDAGVVEGEFQMFEWDGKERWNKNHNRNQDLYSAMKFSTVWVYEIFAEKIGKKRLERYLDEIGYGNKDAYTKKGNYWLEGNLAISAYEQVVFLKKLYRNELAFSVEHQQLVKEIMKVDQGEGWLLSAKTGWEGHCGWWVGWVEWPTGPVFFALNIDTPNRMEDLYKRQAIAQMVLRSLDALPVE